MFNGLRIGVTGMNTSQKTMDNVADQIANSGTNGYKKKEVRFQDLLRNEISTKHVSISDNAGNVSIGAGSRPNFSKTDFRPGVLTESDSPFHMAMDGVGFFGVSTENGDMLLTRNGAFQLNGDGSITDGNGNELVMERFVPQNEWGNNGDITVSSDGLISSGFNPVGRVAIFEPENYDTMYSVGEGKYSVNDGANMRSSLDGNNENMGSIRHKMLEGSNVDIAGSMVEMILTQRAYQLNSKSITTADDMLEVINTII